MYKRQALHRLALREVKSGRRRREEIRQKRLERAKRLEERLRAGPHDVAWPGAGVEESDRALLARHNNTYGTLPAFYVDTIFTCRDCGEEQVLSLIHI